MCALNPRARYQHYPISKYLSRHTTPSVPAARVPRYLLMGTCLLGARLHPPYSNNSRSLLCAHHTRRYLNPPHRRPPTRLSSLLPYSRRIVVSLSLVHHSSSPAPIDSTCSRPACYPGPVALCSILSHSPPTTSSTASSSPSPRPRRRRCRRPDRPRQSSFPDPHASRRLCRSFIGRVDAHPLILTRTSIDIDAAATTHHPGSCRAPERRFVLFNPSAGADDIANHSC